MRLSLMTGVAVVCFVAGGLASWQWQKYSNDSPTSTSTSAAPSEGTSGYSPEPQLTVVSDRSIPAFQLSSLDNSIWTQETLKGKPWVINFWATWCPPCIEELPSMNAAYEKLAPHGVEMLAINAGEGPQAVSQFLQRVAIDFPNILGNQDSLPNWSVTALPTTLVIDAEGNVVFKAVGPREWDDDRILQRVVDLL